MLSEIYSLIPQQPFDNHPYSGQVLHLNMLLLTVAALAFWGLAVSAKFVQPNATEVSNLLVELSELPSCAVCIHLSKTRVPFSADDMILQTNCVTTGLTTTTCSPADFACQCEDEAYMAFSETCILTHCTIRPALGTRREANKQTNMPNHLY